jgi:hypothetical protein
MVYALRTLRGDVSRASWTSVVETVNDAHREGYPLLESALIRYGQAGEEIVADPVAKVIHTAGGMSRVLLYAGVDGWGNTIYESPLDDPDVWGDYYRLSVKP